MKINPTVYVRLPSDEVCQQILKRSILIKEIIDVYSECQLERKSRERSRSPEQATAKVEEEKKSNAGACDDEFDENYPYSALTHSYETLRERVDMERLTKNIFPGKKFRFSLEGIGRKISMKEQLAIIELFKNCGFQEEDISLDKPEVVYRVVENATDRKAYFGLMIASCKPDLHKKGKNFDTYYTRYNLKQRPYLGPTSTDHELAFLMVNQAHVCAGDYVYDPFCGTGSIAVALQHF